MSIFGERKIPVPRKDIFYFNNNIPKVTKIKNSKNNMQFKRMLHLKF
jgi:hypothetical protein